MRCHELWRSPGGLARRAASAASPLSLALALGLAAASMVPAASASPPGAAASTRDAKGPAEEGGRRAAPPGGTSQDASRSGNAAAAGAPRASAGAVAPGVSADGLIPRPATGELAATVGELLRLDAQEALQRSRLATAGPGVATPWTGTMPHPEGAAAPGLAMPAPSRSMTAGLTPPWATLPGAAWPPGAETHVAGASLAPAVPWAAATSGPSLRPSGRPVEPAWPQGLTRDALANRPEPTSGEQVSRAVPILLSIQGLRGEDFDHRRAELLLEDEVHVLGPGQSLPGGLRLQAVAGACVVLQHPESGSGGREGAVLPASRTAPDPTTPRRSIASPPSSRACASHRSEPGLARQGACPATSAPGTRDRHCLASPPQARAGAPAARSCPAPIEALSRGDPPLRLCLPVAGAPARDPGVVAARGLTVSGDGPAAVGGLGGSRERLAGVSVPHVAVRGGQP